MIDVKELRIGAHVSLRGERVTIFQTIYTGLVEVIRPNKEFEVCTTTDELDPIPLTAELLQEIGFERLAQLGSMSTWARDDIYISIVGERVAARIVNDKNDLSISSIRYLHELEAFVYLTTKQELIKED